MIELSNRLGVVRVAGFAVAVVVCAGVAEAWPIRGPVARAERRVIRAQVALERELARPLGRVRVVEVPAPPAQALTPTPAPAQATARPLAPPAAAAAAAPAPQPGVARTAFEAPLPTQAADAPRPASPTEPASDGTVSVLVRPETKAPNQQPAQQPAQQRPAEPLLFPGSAQP